MLNIVFSKLIKGQAKKILKQSLKNIVKYKKVDDIGF